MYIQINISHFTINITSVPKFFNRRKSDSESMKWMCSVEQHWSRTWSHSDHPRNLYKVLTQVSIVQDVSYTKASLWLNFIIKDRNILTLRASIRPAYTDEKMRIFLLADISQLRPAQSQTSIENFRVGDAASKFRWGTTHQQSAPSDLPRCRVHYASINDSGLLHPEGAAAEPTWW